MARIEGIGILNVGAGDTKLVFDDGETFGTVQEFFERLRGRYE